MNEPALNTRSAGALLRAARERQGLHIAALAAAIKVSPRKLEALEADRLAELPDATFTRALAQTVCRTLKIDARPVLELLPPAPSVALQPNNGGLNAPFRERPGREEPGLSAAALRPLSWAALLLVVAAVAMYFAPAGLWRPAPAPAVPPTAAVVPPPVLVPAPLAVEQPASAVAQAASEPAAAASAVQEPAAVPSATAAQPPFVAAAPVAAPASVPAPDGLVQLRPRAASWVEARDGRGQVLLYRTVQPGESVGLNGSLPIRLTIGNASAMQLAFRGQPVELVARTRDNVARLELQ
jgi:cytoskeleton protein RodZ